MSTEPYVVKINRKRDNFTLYIGREFAGLPQSKWHNPFHAFPELADQVLGCWCCPDFCHGDVLVKLYKKVCSV